MKNSISSHLEWEMLREPITISKVDDRPELPRGEKKITVNRDEDYNLKATLYFKDPEFARILYEQSALAGGFAETFDIQGSSSQSLLCTLESCVVGGLRLSRMQGQEESGTGEIILHGLRMRYGNGNEGTHRADWYVNGPKNSVSRRVTDRKVSSRFLRERFAENGKIDSAEVTMETERSANLDFLRIKSRDLQFLVSQVPSGFGPSWSSNISIEYRKAWGRIPDLPEREKIEELCSFVFGRQLLPVGYTIYDQNENPVEGYANDPWGAARWLCSKGHDRPPIRISASNKAEDLISELLPAYCEKRDVLHFKEALWSYWISRAVPPGMNLPILSAAVESIIGGWFESKWSESRGKHLKEEDFETLLQPEIGYIRTKLEEKLKESSSSDSVCERCDAIIAKMREAHELGVGKKYRKFFEEIKLPVDDFELKAIEERNKFAHGARLLDETDWKQVVRQVDTFETLLNRVLLKLLGYPEAFIDRSRLGWEDRQMS